MGCFKVLLSLCLVLQSFLFVVPSAGAASPQGVVFAQILAGNPSAAAQEFVSLYNNSENDIDITGWCLENKAGTKFACISAAANEKIFLPSRSYAKIASSGYESIHPTISPDHYDVVYAPASQSSGSIVGSSDTIKLYDGAGSIVDSIGWSTSLASGNIWQRSEQQSGVLKDTDATDISVDFIKLSSFIVPASGTYEVDTVVDVCTNIAGIQATMPSGYLADDTGACQPDMCLNMNGLQVSVPSFFDRLSDGNCIERDVCNNLEGAQHVVLDGYLEQVDGSCKLDLLPLQITEILPNVSGSDTGHEYIEVYNPTDKNIDLSRYVIRIGVNGDKTFSFPAGAAIAGHEYKVFYDSDMKFTLVNTLGKVALFGIDGTLVGQTENYDSPDDDMAWALIDGSWHYTDQPTPGAANLASLPESDSASSASGTLASCPAGKYRHPLTNRCRNIDSDASVLASCDADQYRNPETGRCRKIATVALVTPCKDGQYRSEETNRCRNIVTANSLAQCSEGQERNLETNRCRNVAAKSVPEAAFAVQPVKDGMKAFIGWWALGGVGIIAIGYAGWEWRREVMAFVRKIPIIRRAK